MSFCVEKAISSIDWRVFDDVARDCINVMARTQPVQSTRFIKREGFDITNCSWTSSWWARLIKWCLKKKYLSRLVPYPRMPCVRNRGFDSLPDNYVAGKYHQLRNGSSGANTNGGA